MPVGSLYDWPSSHTGEITAAMQDTNALAIVLGPKLLAVAHILVL